MSYNGNGVFLINTAGQPVVANTVISATTFNLLTADLANGLTNAITKDGQTTVTANIPMSNFKITGLGAATAANDAVRLEQLTSGATNVSFGNLAYTGTLTGGTGVVNIGSGQVYKDASGNVGIGTTSPGEKLDVVGAIRSTISGKTAQFNAAGGSIYGEFADGTSTWRIGNGIISAGLFSLYNTTTATQAFNVTTSGNVGIGTSSPSGKFNVAGGRAFFGGNSEQYSIGVGYNQSRVSTGAQVYYIGATDSATPALVFSEAGGNERMRIEAGGNVGIGTASPGVKLDVNGALRVGLASNPTTIASNSQFYDQFGIGPTISGFNFAVRTGNPTPTESMRIDSSGNLLVGTTSVNGRISSVPKSGFAPAITAGTWATDAGVSSSGSFGGGFSWIDGSGGYCAWVDDGGTDFNIAGGLTSNAVANGVFLNGYAATSWSGRSDERLKQNLQPITDALNKTCSLRAVTGAYKNFPDEPQAFLIAQDVQKVLPEAVCVADKRSPEQYLGLAYTQVIPLLVAAIQELKAEIDLLKGN